jgi:hypothetical protein
MLPEVDVVSCYQYPWRVPYEVRVLALGRMVSGGSVLGTKYQYSIEKPHKKYSTP